MLRRTLCVARISFPLVVVFTTLIGCSSGPDEIADLTTSGDESPATHAPAPITAAVQLTKVDKAGYDAEIAKHKGKVVVVDFWATWCEPCKERFPHLVELSNQFDPEQVAFVSMSLDMADLEDQAVKFLMKNKAQKLTNLITTLDTADAFEAHDIHDGIPNYKLYDREGKLLHRFSQLGDAEASVLPNDELDVKLREALAK